MREYPLHTETQEHHGLKVRIEYFPDYDLQAPWIENDGYGVIRECRSYYGKPEKKPGEVILYSDRGHYWLYDVQATTKKAHAEGWGISKEYREEMTRELGREPTARELVARAVGADMDYCRGYLRDEWQYVGIVCTVLNAQGEETEHTDSCWGFETWGDYHKTAAWEMADSLAHSVMCERLAAWRAALKEARARKYWASRDVQTVGA